MKVEFFIPSSVNGKSYYFQMLNYCLICLKGTCVLENGNYSEPRLEVESKSEWDTRVHWTHLFTKKTGLLPLHSGFCPSHYFWQTMKEDQTASVPEELKWITWKKHLIRDVCLLVIIFWKEEETDKTLPNSHFRNALFHFTKHTIKLVSISTSKKSDHHHLLWTLNLKLFLNHRQLWIMKITKFL